MKFRPCIDLHQGRVKQIVGSTFSDDDPEAIRVNFSSDRPASWYAKKYRDDGLTGGHVIRLGPGNDAAAAEVLRAFPGGFHLGGGVNAENAAAWLDRGASHVIVTSYVFRDGRVDEGRLRSLVSRVGRQRLVLDLSCRERDGRYWVVTDRWRKFTEVEVTHGNLEALSEWCDEFLVHAADVEGRCEGVDEDLVGLLGKWQGSPVTYAGGIRSLGDVDIIREAGSGRLDFTVGSALDIYGGTGLTYEEVLSVHRGDR